jgi:DNA-nicking Smr family endonuclease
MNETFYPLRKSPQRRLSAEEVELWLNVTQGVAPRLGRRLPELPQAAADMKSPAPTDVSHAPEGAVAGVPVMPDSNRRAPALAPLERRLRQKLAHGHAAPEAAIDLHGMCCQEAFSALRRFLAKAQADGARLVLVVTGKGERPGSGSMGILRNNVPHWLRSAEYHSIVSGFEEAARPHGGAGALYVKLRRRDRAIRGTRRERSEF